LRPPSLAYTEAMLAYQQLLAGHPEDAWLRAMSVVLPVSWLAAMIAAVGDEATGMEIPADDPRAVELTIAVHGGDIETIRRLLSQDPQLARAWITDSKGFSTPLHLVADWPGYSPTARRSCVEAAGLGLGIVSGHRRAS